MSEPGTADVLVAGEYYCDLIFAGLQHPPALGAEFYADDLVVRPGGTYTMALALTRLGVATRWACSFGTDLFSRLVLEAAAADGIHSGAFVHVDGPQRRVSAAFSQGSERGFISFSEPGIAAPDPAMLARWRPQWLLQTFRFEPDWLAFIRAAKQAGIKVFSDCRHVDFTLDTPGVREFLALTDVFSPNLAEAQALTGTDDPHEAIAVLARSCPALALKCGPDGAIGWHAGQDIRCPAPKVDVVDTVGAGDAFNAGFLHGMLQTGSFAQALRTAVLCGALSTTGPGSSAVPDAQILARWRDL